MMDQPDSDMLAAVEQIARFIATGDEAMLRAFAPDGVVILENFSPHLFFGPDAVERWAKGMREHAATLTNLRHSFGPAQDFSCVGAQAFFSLPTHWQGMTGGRPFREDGGWSFLLVKEGGSWRVQSYGWAVTHVAYEP
jgi:hypothetical protein